ncbi:hypothetical protein B0H12DRAFT_1160882 [Mycena haematopus]|nr:hypothetical protein B0H12DRAFT_1160882 [Mycena haematopus]
MACFTATSNSAAPQFQQFKHFIMVCYSKLCIMRPSIHEKLCRCTPSIKFRDNHPEFRCFVPMSLTVTHCDPL